MPIAPRAPTIAVLALATTIACQRKPRETAPGAPPSPSGVRAPHGKVVAPLAGERIDIPGGTFKAGSVPGEAGRKPEIEERLTTVELGPFRIDRLPYPNDPAAPPKTAVTRADAERLCAERGARLCTEIEWERACKGPNSTLYAGGEDFPDSCVQAPETCASGFDVLGMGALREWTASDVVPDGDGPRKAAVRGAAKGSPREARRCAARSSESADSSSDTLGFRCCKGAKNAVLVKEPRAGVTFSQASITPQKLAALFAANEHTKRLATNVRFFREPDGAETVVARGPGDRKGFLFTVAPLRWNPVAGAEFLVVSGRSGEDTSFVAVFHALDDGEYLLAASFIMEHEVGPVALAYNGYIRPRLHFSTCWGCPGETGKILYRDPDAVVIAQP
ncbi:MAG TPA: SUMF1/EgtB/PvdO family nonheme iron enzyme [Polyangiaceae bacterium]|nr:SUMF1/EgtB/PvdO family nonheme iron enzyme [Polyangiaceae bacterium]